MKLDQENLDYILNVVKTAKLVGIEGIAIEPNLVRGYDLKNNSVLILQTVNVPDMSFGSIGMGRLDIFSARYEILRTQDKFSIEADIDMDAQCTRSLILKAKGTKIDFRCAKPVAIKGPKQVNETFKHRVHMNSESALLMQKAISAMEKPDVVTLLSNNEGVSFEFLDVNNDKFSHTFMEKVESLTPDATGKFAHRYLVETLFPLIKHNPDGHFDVGQKGILAFTVNNLTVYVLPQI